ncbi:MAG TPA: hypothetical protein VED46_18065 [Alphaproteobacteria bacterium]|nr:hypothetical protein [Alphaproteobacteria bacterium]
MVGIAYMGVWIVAAADMLTQLTLLQSVSKAGAVVSKTFIDHTLFWHLAGACFYPAFFVYPAIGAAPSNISYSRMTGTIARLSARRTSFI